MRMIPIVFVRRTTHLRLHQLVGSREPQPRPGPTTRSLATAFATHANAARLPGQ
jgi:hypothetical protein